MLDYEKMEDGRICFKVKKELYPLKAVYRAAYLLTDEYYIGIDQDQEEYIILFSEKIQDEKGQKSESDYADVGRFQNELLNQSMKLAINNDTRQIRELIVTRALYSAFIPQDEYTDETIGESTEITENEEFDLEEIAEAWNSGTE